MQKNDYFIAKFGVDTAENEPLGVWRKWKNYSIHSLVGTEAAGGASERGVEGVGAGVCVGLRARGGPVRNRDQREWSEPHGSEAPSEEASGVAIHNPNEILRAKCLTYVNV